MLLKELTQKSPIRTIDEALHGGLGAGNIGAILARHGVGKTACLVQIGLDAGLRKLPVLHVALGHTASHVRDWYTEIFKDMASAYKLEDSYECLLMLERNRRIHAYVGQNFSAQKLKDTIEFNKTYTEFEPKVILLEMDLGSLSLEELKELKAIAVAQNAEMWIQGVTHREDEGYKGDSIPKPFTPYEPIVSVFLKLESVDGAVVLRLVKEHENTEASDLKVKLDPTTMLLVSA